LQLIGKPFDEETLFRTARVIEEAAGPLAKPNDWWSKAA
jgi:aspartyl-tRNA(Asn)/glutamyl-tRNA(Gln) amidotransferase subunit A